MNNDLSSLNNTKPLETVGNEPTPVEPVSSEPVPEAPVSNGPTPVIGPVSAPTPAMTMDQKPKKNNTWIIIVIAVLVLVVGGVLLFTQTDIFKKKEETKTEEKKDKKEEKKEEDQKGENKEDYSKYNGVYTYGNNVLKIFYDDNNIRYCINDSQCSYLELEDGKWSYNHFDEKTNATFNDSGLVFETNQGEGLSGTYKKTKDYTIADYFGDNEGDVSLFNSKYNGGYKLGDVDMFTFQSDKTEVRVLIEGQDFSFDVPFDIKEDGSLYVEFLDNIYVVTFDADGNATFTTTKGEKEHDGVYKKQGNIEYKDILRYTL